MCFNNKDSNDFRSFKSFEYILKTKGKCSEIKFCNQSVVLGFVARAHSTQGIQFKSNGLINEFFQL